MALDGRATLWLFEFDFLQSSVQQSCWGQCFGELLGKLTLLHATFLLSSRGKSLLNSCLLSDFSEALNLSGLKKVIWQAEDCISLSIGRGFNFFSPLISSLLPTSPLDLLDFIIVFSFWITVKTSIYFHFIHSRFSLSNAVYPLALHISPHPFFPTSLSGSSSNDSILVVRVKVRWSHDISFANLWRLYLLLRLFLLHSCQLYFRQTATRPISVS